jgi:predicted amidohydrolase
VPPHQEHVTEDHWLHEVIELALKHDIDIVAGTVVELGTHHAASSAQHASDPKRQEAASLYNTSYYVERTGKILSRYTKRNLWHPERQVLTAAPLPPLLAASQGDSSHSQAQASAKPLSDIGAQGHEHPKPFTITTKRGGSFTAGMLICWDLAWPDIFRSYLVREGDKLVGPDVCVLLGVAL